MAVEFPIENQEAFDAAAAEIYSGWISPEDVQKLNDKISKLNQKISANETKITELTAENQTFKTKEIKLKIAGEVGLDAGLADRLSGATEDEIREDAKALSALVGKNSGGKSTPNFTSEKSGESSTMSSAFSEILSSLNA